MVSTWVVLEKCLVKGVTPKRPAVLGFHLNDISMVGEADWWLSGSKVERRLGTGCLSGTGFPFRVMTIMELYKEDKKYTKYH